MSRIGQRIRRSRIGSGLTQSELADKVGVSTLSIHNWETGKVRPTKKLENLEAVLGQLSSDSEDDSGGPSVNRGSPIGTWLTRTRLSRDMSVAELAYQSGVSMPGIYNIEAGRTPNPRQQTLNDLQDALDEFVPEDALEETRDDATIEGLGELSDFDPYEDDERPTVSGIYVLYDISERAIYVGQGSNIKNRIRDHEDRFWFKPPIVETASFVQIDEADLRKKAEALLIRFMKSNAVINKQLVDR